MIFLAELAFKSDRLLGWEGDENNLLMNGTGSEVSNPLGWEGDPSSRTASRCATAVSNPLGWEGDTRGTTLFVTTSRFLIH